LTEKAGHKFDGHENEGHEIDRQKIERQGIIISFENRLHYNAACNSF